MNGPLLQAAEEGEVPQQLNLSREEIQGLDLSELTFRDTSFHACRFMECRFDGATFYACTFSDCLFVNCLFPVSFWSRCQLSGCKADGADFRRSRFKDCLIQGVSLRYANLSHTVWERDTPQDTSLLEVSLAESKLSKLTFQGVDLTGAELFRTSFKGLDLTGCTLDQIVLSESCSELKGAKIGASQAAVVAQILGIQVDPSY